LSRSSSVFREASADGVGSGAGEDVTASRGTVARDCPGSESEVCGADVSLVAGWPITWTLANKTASANRIHVRFIAVLRMSSRGRISVVFGWQGEPAFIAFDA